MKSIKFLEEHGVNVKKSLELFGDSNTYNETIGEFLVEIHKKINELIKFLNKKDMTNYSIYVHSLKSDAKYFGFDDLAQVAYEHEQKSKNGDFSFVTSHINDLINETNKAIILIKEYMNGTDLEISEKENDSLKFSRDTILVVDDSNIIRNFVKRIFSEEYNVGVAKDGEEALNIIKANKNNGKIVTILLDLNMPKVDGFAVLDYMKKNDLFEIIPTSIISGDSSKETIDRAFTYNIVDMLSKPFNEKSIKSIILKTISRRDLI